MRMPVPENKAPEEAEGPGFLLKHKKLLIVVGALMVFLLLAGIAIGVSLALISNIDVYKSAEVEIHGGKMHIYKVQN